MQRGCKGCAAGCRRSPFADRAMLRLQPGLEADDAAAFPTGSAGEEFAGLAYREPAIALLIGNENLFSTDGSAGSALYGASCITHPLREAGIVRLSRAKWRQSQPSPNAIRAFDVHQQSFQRASVIVISPFSAGSVTSITLVSVAEPSKVKLRAVSTGEPTSGTKCSFQQSLQPSGGGSSKT